MNFVFKGMLIGFSIAAPVGPIGVLCIRRSVAHGRLSGLATRLGAAVAQFNLEWMRALNRISGSIIFGFGVYSLFTALVKG